jgi:hypothetical protein
VVGLLLLIARGRATGTSGDRPRAGPSSLSGQLAFRTDAPRIAEPPGDAARGFRWSEPAARVLRSGCFQFAACGLAVVLLLARFVTESQNRYLGPVLLGLLALAELGWYGNNLLTVAPAEQFMGRDPIGDALVHVRAQPAEDVEPAASFETDQSALSVASGGSRASAPRLECAAAAARESGPVVPPPRIKARDSFYGDLPAIVHGIEKTNVADAFQLDHAAVLYETLYPVASRIRPMADRLLSQSAKDTWRRIRQAVLDRMSVTHLVSDRVEVDPCWPVAFKGVWNGSNFVIQRNPTALPRAYVVPHAALVPDHSGVVLTSLSDFDPHATVLMSHDPLRGLPPGRRQAFTPALWTSTDPDRPALAVSIDAPGLLVVAETWMPGWMATVDGRPAPVLRGNLCQRVIPLPEPGHHAIVMAYHPPGFLTGLVITLGSVVVWLAILMRQVRTRWAPLQTTRLRLHVRLIQSRRRMGREILPVSSRKLCRD